jgi:glycosyltransferase involved in cell wall biosynthesis
MAFALTSNNGEKTPAVTVLMPMYNSAPFLGEAVDSILGQTFSDFELLIIDNDSTDNGPEIIKGYRDPRIRYVKNERNIGLAASLNRGIKLARGEFIARMDADDIARRDRLKLQVDYLRRHPDVGLCGGQIMKVVDGARHWMKFPLTHEENRVTLLFHTCFPHPAVMLRRNVLIDHELFYKENLRNVEDYDLWVRLINKTRTANLPDFVLDYRSHSQQLSGENYRLITELRHEVNRSVVERLIPHPTGDEMNLHGDISVHHEPFSREKLRRGEVWLLRLLKANDQAGFFDARAMRAVFGRRWAAICGQVLPLDMSVYVTFLRSPLAAGAVFTVPSMKLLVKCVLGKSYD